MGTRLMLKGRRFGRWTAIKHRRVGKNYRYSEWLCRCECGTIRWVNVSNLTQNASRSCGCYRDEMTIKRSTKHGLTRSPEYASWTTMKSRCYNKNNKKYPRYGGRGISVCKKWKDSFESFVHDMGRRPSPKHSLGRINNDKDYYPSNCRWETPDQQSANRSNSIFLVIDGKRMTLLEWSKAEKMPAKTLYRRIRDGWDHKRAVFQKMAKKL